MEHPLLSKRVCNVALRLFAAISFFFTGTASHAAVPAPNSVGFWYADDPPLQELAQFDWVVVEPGQRVITGQQLRAKAHFLCLKSVDPQVIALCVSWVSMQVNRPALYFERPPVHRIVPA